MNDAFKYAMKMNDLGFIYHVENEILFILIRAKMVSDYFLSR